VLRKGGLLLLEMLLVLRAPFRRGVTERDLGVIDLLGLDGERERDSTEAGLLERVRSLPRETERDGISFSKKIVIEAKLVNRSVQ
jgi:hypothetical protein